VKYIVALLPVLVATLGGMAFIYGGADDSPGLQLIGVVLVVGAVTLVVRNVGRSRS
jgi:hypothetical protein